MVVSEQKDRTKCVKRELAKLSHQKKQQVLSVFLKSRESDEKKLQLTVDLVVAMLHESLQECFNEQVFSDEST